MHVFINWSCLQISVWVQLVEKLCCIFLKNRHSLKSVVLSAIAHLSALAPTTSFSSPKARESETRLHSIQWGGEQFYSKTADNPIRISVTLGRFHQISIAIYQFKCYTVASLWKKEKVRKVLEDRFNFFRRVRNWKKLLGSRSIKLQRIVGTLNFMDPSIVIKKKKNAFSSETKLKS